MEFKYHTHSGWCHPIHKDDLFKFLGKVAIKETGFIKYYAVEDDHRRYIIEFNPNLIYEEEMVKGNGILKEMGDVWDKAFNEAKAKGLQEQLCKIEAIKAISRVKKFEIKFYMSEYDKKDEVEEQK